MVVNGGVKNLCQGRQGDGDGALIEADQGLAETDAQQDQIRGALGVGYFDWIRLADSSRGWLIFARAAHGGEYDRQDARRQ